MMIRPLMALLGVAAGLLAVFLAAGLWSATDVGWSASAMSAPAPSASPTSDAGTRKQELEIEKLRQETGAGARVRNWLSAGGFVVALGGAGFSAFQYFTDRRRDRDVRVQEQFSKYLMVVAQYPQAPERTSATLLAALTSLRDLIEHAAKPEIYRGQVTQVIQMVTLQDLDFEDPKQARFDSMCLTHWPDYRAWLSENPRRHGFLLYRYRQAFRVLAEKHPGYFSSMRVAADGELAVEFYIDEGDYLHFQQLLAGYSEQLAVGASAAGRESDIDQLGEALGNPQLARQLIPEGNATGAAKGLMS